MVAKKMKTIEAVSSDHPIVSTENEEKSKPLSKVHFEENNKVESKASGHASEYIKKSPFDPTRIYDLPMPKVESIRESASSPQISPKSEVGSFDSVLTTYSNTSFARSDDSEIVDQTCFDRWFRRPSIPLTRHAKDRIRLPVSKLEPGLDVPWRALYLKLPLKTHQHRTIWCLKLLPSCTDVRDFDRGGRSLLWHAVRVGDWFAVQALLGSDHGQYIIQKDRYLKLDVTHLAILFDQTISAEQRIQSVPDPRDQWNPDEVETRGLDEPNRSSWRQFATRQANQAKAEIPFKNFIGTNDESALSDTTSDDEYDGELRKKQSTNEQWAQDQINRRKVRQLIYDEVKRHKKSGPCGSVNGEWANCLRRLRGLNKTLQHSWLLGPTSYIEWYSAFKMMPLPKSQAHVARFQNTLNDLNDSILAPDLNGASILWHACRIENNGEAIKCLVQVNSVMRIARTRDRLFKLEPYDVAALRGDTYVCDIIQQFIYRARRVMSQRKY